MQVKTIKVFNTLLTSLKIRKGRKHQGRVKGKVKPLWLLGWKGRKAFLSKKISKS